MTPEQKAAAIEMLKDGVSQSAVAGHFSVTKNVISGIWARGENTKHRLPPPKTLFDRCDALHAKMDAILAETRNVGRVP